ncbi:Mg chelatase, subunit ChlI [Verminephrobacter eiseniae EF01-2]|uniref:Mg chelatase, subunit ChlI n=2 Tax=Verminephrobacter eiseniae TaxID=364317 RepID=A1WN39_VEREI|nr:Mg chelatase, subunit ChlI [Verminephrobacter eiseniae EF01-2]
MPSTDRATALQKSPVRYSGAGDAARATQGFGPCPALVQHRARPHPGSARRTHSGRIRFMSLALVQSRALLGLQAPCVTVEVHLANGLPSFTLVGLAEVEVKEARERVRSALQNAGLEFPHNKRITVNLAPADLPKDSGRFDLPIALGILAASGQIDASRLAGHEFAGELSLTGELRPVRGALATSLALQTQQIDVQLVLPPGSAEEAALVPGAQVVRARHLLDVVRAFLPPGSIAGDAKDSASDGWSRLQPRPMAASTSGPDMADVKGQATAKRALEIAAAGGHSLLMVGPPGAGKSMLAQRFAGLLPAMTVSEALESAALASLAGRFRAEAWGQRPTIAPHHSASAVALVGGGAPPRPGEISLAHQGVLFLDELPEFPRAALEALRQPLESGHISIARAAQRADFPARFQLVAAMNPCPCGFAGATQRACRCTPDQISRYQSKLSGPLLDRIDLHVEVPALPAEQLLQASAGETSAAIRERVARARALALARQGKSNQALQGQEIDTQLHLNAGATQFLHSAATRLGWSARSTHRALKVARSIADLAGSPGTELGHVAEAMQYRRVLR